MYSTSIVTLDSRIVDTARNTITYHVLDQKASIMSPNVIYKRILGLIICIWISDCIWQRTQKRITWKPAIELRMVQKFVLKQRVCDIQSSCWSGNLHHWPSHHVWKSLWDFSPVPVWQAQIIGCLLVRWTDGKRISLSYCLSVPSDNLLRVVLAF